MAGRIVRPRTAGGHSTAPKTVEAPVRVVRTPSVEETAMKALVDRYAVLDAERAKAAAEAKAVTKRTESEFKELSEKILAYAKANKKKWIEGTRAAVEVKPLTSSSIDPKALLSYLKRAGSLAMFFGLVKVGITEAKKSLGEKVLKNNGVLTESTNEYAGLNVKGR
jgi:hypothetical protein